MHSLNEMRMKVLLTVANGRNMLLAHKPVYFGFDSSAIASAERVKLQKAAEYLLENPSATS